jgi:hypothetical protein
MWTQRLRSYAKTNLWMILVAMMVPQTAAKFEDSWRLCPGAHEGKLGDDETHSGAVVFSAGGGPFDSSGGYAAAAASASRGGGRGVYASMHGDLPWHIAPPLSEEAMTLSVAQLAMLLRHVGLEEDVEPMVTRTVTCQLLWRQLRAPMCQHTPLQVALETDEVDDEGHVLWKRSGGGMKWRQDCLKIVISRFSSTIYVAWLAI